MCVCVCVCVYVCVCGVVCVCVCECAPKGASIHGRDFGDTKLQCVIAVSSLKIFLLIYGS